MAHAIQAVKVLARLVVRGLVALDVRILVKQAAKVRAKVDVRMLQEVVLPLAVIGVIVADITAVDMVADIVGVRDAHRLARQVVRQVAQVLVQDTAMELAVRHVLLLAQCRAEAHVVAIASRHAPVVALWLVPVILVDRWKMKILGRMSVFGKTA